MQFKGKPRIISMYMELTSLKRDCNENVSDYIIKIDTTLQALRNAGEA